MKSETAQHLYPSVERVMEVTAFKDVETATAAIKTLAWLDAGAPHKVEGFKASMSFDMRKYISDDMSDCGTACCIAGAIQQFKHEGNLKYYEPNAMKMHFNDEHLGQVGNHHKSKLRQLFYPVSAYRGLILKATPERAATTLRQYLFTGEVDWNMDNDWI